MTPPAHTEAVIAALAEWETDQSDLTDLALRLATVSAGFDGGYPFRDTLSFAYRTLLASEREASSRRVGELEAALRPFAAIAECYAPQEDDTHEVWLDAGPITVHREVKEAMQLRTFRRARAALNPKVAG